MILKLRNFYILNNFLEVTFEDGAFTKISIQSILKEFANDNDIKLIEKSKMELFFKRF
jgi:hypothetical protein